MYGMGRQGHQGRQGRQLSPQYSILEAIQSQMLDKNGKISKQGLIHYSISPVRVGRGSVASGQGQWLKSALL